MEEWLESTVCVREMNDLNLSIAIVIFKQVSVPDRVQEF